MAHKRFTPVATSYEGLTARELYPTWQALSVLNEGILPAKAKSDLACFRSEGLAFTREGDFNRNGRRDRAVYGCVRRHRRTLRAILARPGA